MARARVHVLLKVLLKVDLRSYGGREFCFQKRFSKAINFRVFLANFVHELVVCLKRHENFLKNFGVFDPVVLYYLVKLSGEMNFSMVTRVPNVLCTRSTKTKHIFNLYQCCLQSNQNHREKYLFFFTKWRHVKLFLSIFCMSFPLPQAIQQFVTKFRLVHWLARFRGYRFEITFF